MLAQSLLAGLEAEDLLILQACIREAVECLPNESEFSSRVGVTRTRALEVCDQLIVEIERRRELADPYFPSS